jgi:membrane protein DedA with SNARE-associated domain
VRAASSVSRPLAGSVGLPFKVFFLGNATGALCYVPVEVGIGFALAYGVGHLSAHHAQQAQLALGITLVVSVTAFAMLHLTGRSHGAPASE